MSNNYTENIKEFVSVKLPHGLTILPVVGGYSKKDKQLLMIVVEQADYKFLISNILRINSEAFITVADVSMVRGGGTLKNEKVLSNSSLKPFLKYGN